jgi:hypothetical protein
MTAIDRRLRSLEAEAAQRRAQRDHAAGAKERILARLNAIGQRLRGSGVVTELDANEAAQRVALVKAKLQSLKEGYRAQRP